MTASDTVEKALSLLASHRMARLFPRLARVDNKDLDILIELIDQWLEQQEREAEGTDRETAMSLADDESRR